MMSSRPTLDGLRIERHDSGNAARRRWRSVAALAVVALAGLALWWHFGHAPLAVYAVLARERDADSERTVLNASGYVTARRQATVSSKVTGKVAEVLIEEGMRVQAGQALARLDDRNARASLAVAEAQLASARSAVDETRAHLALAEAELQRTVDLAGQDIATQSDLDRARAEAATTRARLTRNEFDVTVAQRQVELGHLQLEDLVIRAPFDGICTTKDAQPGEMISPVSAGGGFTRTGIGTIVDMQSLEIEVDVNESYIHRVTAGQQAEAVLDAYTDWKIPCKVVAIVPTADREKSTVRVRVGFDALDPRILPEMAVKVAFLATGPESAGPAVVIPRGALQTRDGRDVAFVVRQGLAVRREVTVRQARGGDAELEAGVAAGDTVVVDPPAGLADGARVEVLAP